MKDKFTKYEMKELQKLGMHIKNLRIEKGITQKDLADLTGISEQSISPIEGGKQNPSYTTIVLFAKAFDMTISDFFKDIED